jgi:hypothetical protein
MLHATILLLLATHSLFSLLLVLDVVSSSVCLRSLLHSWMGESFVRPSFEKNLVEDLHMRLRFTMIAMVRCTSGG